MKAKKLIFQNITFNSIPLNGTLIGIKILSIDTKFGYKLFASSSFVIGLSYRGVKVSYETTFCIAKPYKVKL